MKNCKRALHDLILLLTGAALSFGWWVYILNRPPKHSIRLHDNNTGRDSQ